MFRERRLFRMFLRGLGVFFAARGLVQLASELSLDLENQTWLQEWSLPSLAWIYHYLSPFASIAIGAYLFFAGRTLLEWVLPLTTRRCWECGYNLTGNRSGRCPECGLPLLGRVHEPAPALEPSIVCSPGVMSRLVRWTPHLVIAWFAAWAVLCAAHVVWMRLEGQTVVSGC